MDNTAPSVNRFELESQIMLTSVKTTMTLFQEENGADAVALYFFYYQNAKRQDTNQIRCTQNFCMKGLHWGDKKFREAKAVLEKYKLVEIIKSGSKWYVKINYVKRFNSPQNEVVEIEPNSHQKEVLDSEGTNALLKQIHLNAYTVTNVTDGVSAKRPCPLITDPLLKNKYSKGHTECVEYVTSFRFVNKAKQFKFLHQMLRAGLDFPDIDRIIRTISKKSFYQENGYDLASVASEADRRSNASA